MLCVVDEGARVIMDSNNRVQNEDSLLRQQYKRIHLFYGLYLAITRKWIYPALTYFSIYQLSLFKQDILICNEYNYFKQNKIQQILLKEHAIVIVGQPMSELKIITSSTYQQIIQNILAKYKEYTVYYAPHPIETEYKQWLPGTTIILNTQYPLELLLIANHIDTIFGFYSTVLLNCASMKLCKNIFSISLDREEYINEENSNQMEVFNKTLKEYGIKILSSKLLNI